MGSTIVYFQSTPIVNMMRLSPQIKLFPYEIRDGYLKKTISWWIAINVNSNTNRDIQVKTYFLGTSQRWTNINHRYLQVLPRCQFFVRLIDRAETRMYLRRRRKCYFLGKAVWKALSPIVTDPSFSHHTHNQRRMSTTCTATNKTTQKKNCGRVLFVSLME